MARPTARPTMPDSASGVSKHRWSPKSRVSPSVMRKTPPRVPTSSPKTSTRSSSCSASRRAWFRACAIVTVGMSVLLRLQFGGQLLALFEELRGGFGEDVVEDLEQICFGVGVHPGAQIRGEVFGLCAHG